MTFGSVRADGKKVRTTMLHLTPEIIHILPNVGAVVQARFNAEAIRFKADPFAALP